MGATKTITLFFILLVIPVSLFAQSNDDLKKAISFYNKGNYSESVKLFDPYLEIKSDPKVYYLKGYALYKMSKFNEARESFRQAYPPDPIPLIAQDKAIVQNNENLKKRKDGLIEAISHYNKGNYSEAVKLFDLYLEKNPDPEVYFLRGYALYKMSKFNEARESFRQAYAIDPGVKVSKASDILIFPDKSD
jgi:Flp pilus assembly protein TadD|tara:strand:+ start:4383 stop:4955 length:573 start_codon:yes stop_codon:yes gene_type:complete